MRRCLAIVVTLAACGGSAPAGRVPVAAPTAGSPAAPPVNSLERIERIARACAPAGTELYATAVWSDGAWKAEARTGEQVLAIDPAASTCNGTKVEAAPVAGELSLDEVVAIAKQCFPAESSSISIGYLVGEGAKQDRSRYEVGFTPATAERTFPMPSYAIDPNARTCGPTPGPHM